jgi:hypothetical protein
LIDRAWLQLLILHTPFVPLDQDEYARLIDRYRELEELILDDPELQEYYAETFLEEGEAKKWLNAAGTRGTDAIPGPTPHWKIHHIAAIQAQLMEDVFYSSRLDRFANASENRGWMNLFRRWGNSQVFRTRFDTMRPTFSRDFVDFYDYYIREHRSIDVSPVPHPWDPPERRRDDRKSIPPLSDDDEEWAKSLPETPEDERPLFPGVYLDSGIREAEPRKPQTPQARPGSHAGGPEKASASSTPPPAPPPAPPPTTSSGDSGGPPNQ